MPKINRVRIANASYDGKYITDELIETFGGADTLFNLANGSGKSVLVQLMLQPVLPCRRMQDRNIDSYLSKTSSPTYVMVEWKLDHTQKPVYFLAGIAMCSIGQGDESEARVRYFTFTHKYDAATEYDIAHTPLIRNTGGVYRYMPYDEAYSLLRNVKDELHPLNCFTRDRRDAYKKNLEEHGIYEEEWKLLARVNNKEGGVDEVFADCKTSDALLDRWILKTITDNASQGEQNLREMFISLMASILAQEETISEKELLDGFIAELDRLLESMSGLCDCMSGMESIAELLSGLYAHIQKRMDELDEEKQAALDVDRGLEEDRRHIEYERLSENWYKAEEKYQARRKALDDCLAVTEAQRSLAEQATRRREVMAAAGYKETISAADANIAALREQAERLAKGPAEQETLDILFSLDKYYADELSAAQAKWESAVKGVAGAEEMIRLYKEEVSQINVEGHAIAAALGSLDNRIGAFEKYEDACQKTLGVRISRTLINELSPNEVDAAQRSLDERSRRVALAGEELNSRLVRDTDTRSALTEDRKKMENDLLETVRQIENKKRERDEYREAAKQLGEITARRGLPARITEIPKNLIALKESRMQRNAELSAIDAQLAFRRETLVRFDAHSLHTAPEFGALLQSKGVAYITGEDYLKDLDAGRQKQALSQNPMLPFCFLVGRSDFYKATSLYADGIDRICPVLVFEEAEENLKSGANAVPIAECGMAMCFYFEESFAQGTIGSFREKLEETIAGMEARRGEWLLELEQIRQDISFLESFPYHSDTQQAIDSQLSALEAASREIRGKIESGERECDRLEASCAELREQILYNRRDRETADSHQNLFKEYLSEDAAYRDHVREKQRDAQRQDELHKRSQMIGRDTEEEYAKKENALMEKKEANQAIDHISQKRGEFIAPASGVLLEWPLEALEKRYQEIITKQSRDEKMILQEIKNYTDKKKTAEKQLRKFSHILDHETEGASFDEDRLDILEEEEKHAGMRLEEAKAEQGKADSNCARAEAERESCRERLREEGLSGPLGRDEIKGGYEARRTAVDRKRKELSSRISHIDEDKEVCKRDIDRITRLIEHPANVAVPPPEGGWDTVNIAWQVTQYRDKEKALANLRMAAAELERDVRGAYNGRHTGVDNVLRTLSLPSLEPNYDAFHAAFERLAGQRKLLQESVRVLLSQLEHLDEQKGYVVYHAFAQGKWLHGELKKISGSSYVKLSPGKPKQQTLKIGVPDDLDQFTLERMGNHVDACIAGLRERKKGGGLTEKDMRMAIDAKLSDRELLNQTIGQHTIDVRLLKVDASQANSRLRTWESVLTDNSGGELFVSCFVLLSALMDYSRRNYAADDPSGGGSKVMLIDNPFGKTSSEHLLDALIKVAGQFNMQMICLSDLSQSSITSKFPLIYQLSLRPAVFGDKSYLKIDSVTKNAELYMDSRLEHVSLRQEQVSMFGN